MSLMIGPDRLANKIKSPPTIREYGDNYRKKWWDREDEWIAHYLKAHLWSKQKEIVKSVFRNRMTIVKASHAIGKTYIAGATVIAFLYNFQPSKVVTTAPTGTQVIKQLWSEINTQFQTHMVGKDDGFPGKILQAHLDIAPNWFAIGISPRDEVNFQGFHSDHILVIVDEAPGVRKEIIDGALSLMSGGNAHMLMIGNPTLAQGHFYEAWNDSLIPKDAKISISAFDSPNFTGEYVPEYVKRRLVNPIWVNEMTAKWGEGSPLWNSKIGAEFIYESEGQLISFNLCERAKHREFDERADMPKTLGVDVARFGDDLSVYLVRQGRKIDKIYQDSKRDTTHVAGRVIRIVDEDRLIKRVNIDVIGIGSGVYDMVLEAKKQGRIPADVIIYAVNVAERAYNSDKYDDLRTELWFGVKEWLETQGWIPDNDMLVADLIAPFYEFTSRGIYVMESKEKTKARLGRSPDFADALMYSLIGEGKTQQPIIEIISLSSEEILRQMGIRV